MTIKNTKAQLLRSTLLAALTVAPGFVASAFAQTAPAAPEEEKDVVVITGSLIARQDYVANSPIVTVGVEDIQATGATTLDTLLNQMPQFVPNMNMTSNNPSNGGQANLQLRGLGTNRTLVLMNGRRVVPSNNDGTVDINLIPSPLVQSIEVITGGASATYGSDALAGVVNFILKDDFEGVQVDMSYGLTDRSDGYQKSFSLSTGGQFDEGRGGAMMMLSYNDRDPVYNAARPFSSISGASAASPLGNTIFDSNNLPTALAISAAVPGAVPADTFGFNNNNTLFDYINRLDFVSPGGITYDGFTQPGPFFNPNFAFNTGALNFLVIPQKRYNAFATVHYDLNDYAEVYTDFLFTQYESANELAASPAASTTGFRVPASNPFITPELRTILNSRAAFPLGSFRLDKRFVALGPRHQSEIYDTYQITTGVRGDLGFGDWTYDAYGMYGRVDRTSIQTGNVSRSAVQTLLNAADGGNSLCAGGFDWFGETSLSAACQAFIGRTSKNLVTIEQRNVNFTAQGGLFELPAGEVRLAAGVSYRQDDYNRIPDGSLTGLITVQPCIAVTTTTCSGFADATTGTTGNPRLTGNDIAGFNPSTFLKGRTDVKEAFAEVLIPVLKDIPLIQELNLTLAGRQSDYNTVGNVSAYKADIDWTVIDGLRLRGGYSQAVRAPSIGELFLSPSLGFPNIGSPNTGAVSNFSGDPCDIRSKYRSTNGSGGNLAASTNTQVRALCVAQGVSAGTVDTYTYTNQQVPNFTGGNPLLSEETADSYSVGVVWSPNFDSPWLAGLSASVDYFKIELADAIGTVDATTMLTQCYNANGTSNPTYDPNNFFCQLFQRDPLSGNVASGQSTNQNLAAAVTSGIDFQVDWGMDIGPGAVDVSFIGTWLEEFATQTLPGGPFANFEGRINNTGVLGDSVGASKPEWKWLAAANYTWGPAKFGARWQHIAEMDNRNNATDVVPAIGYLDLLASWDFSDNLTLRFNVNNVMDELPPTYSPAVSSNTDPSTYDVLGRRYTVGLTARF
ncbi:MAG: TonB-dependent receptor [Hyphomonadaceae bacterium]|nr:TonB-dependent receptor [Hyphomonadaceae bacterium]